jgi:hypothetical protein
MISASPTGPATLSSVPAPDGCQNGEPRLHAGGLLIDGLAQRARHQVSRTASFTQVLHAMAFVMPARDDAVIRQMRHGIVGMVLLQVRRHGIERRRIPEQRHELRRAQPLTDRSHRLGHDQIPAGDRCQCHQHQNRLCHAIGMGQEMMHTNCLTRFHRIL